VRGAERVHLALRDDATVDDVLERARPGLAAGALVIDHTTTSPRGAADRVARWRERGVTYVHAPVFMGPQNAREATGLMMISGDRATIERVRPLLQPMTGKLLELGDRPETAASFKLLGNAFLMCFTAGLADVHALAKALGVAAGDAAKLFEQFNPAMAIGARLARMTSGDYEDPSWELAMARKDAGLMLDAAGAAGVPLALLPAIAARMDAVIAEGFAHHDWTVIARDAVR